MTEQLTFTDLENWLSQTKKELKENKDVNFDLSNVTIEVNKLRVNHKAKRIIIVKVNDGAFRVKLWEG